jgi:hypothetical protein
MTGQALHHNGNAQGVKLFFFFGSTWVWTQDFVLARPHHYHPTSQPLLLLVIFQVGSHITSLLLFHQPAWTSVLLFTPPVHSWNDRCVLSWPTFYWLRWVLANWG